ncbi:MAG: hypothetical protein OEZ38_05400 [Gammaproteobacteria bacterium]|nr:hypothetical protein [Gammaproteobacteria bacterium]
MNSKTALTIKVFITLGLAISGIVYILQTPPNAQYSGSSQKSQNNSGYSYDSDSAHQSEDNASLTGNRNRYEEAKVGD